MMNLTPDGPEQEPLMLFFWDGRANFGDELSRVVVEHVSGRKAQSCGPFKARLFAVGSILKHLEYGVVKRRAGGPLPWIWGSGFMSPMPVSFADKVRVAAVRGEKTAEVLGVKDVPLGDPGILTAEAMGPFKKGPSRIGIVPHWRTVDDLKAHLGDTDEVLLIDPRGTPEDVVPLIASCDMVLSSSLHGLIVADSYGIPNHWIAPRKTHATPRFKFWDYASSIGRHLGKPVEADEVVAFLKAPIEVSMTYGEGIARSKAALVESFPAELKSAASTGTPASGGQSGQEMGGASH